VTRETTEQRFAIAIGVGGRKTSTSDFKRTVSNAKDVVDTALNARRVVVAFTIEAKLLGNNRLVANGKGTLESSTPLTDSMFRIF
jgi:hypothetical protein